MRFQSTLPVRGATAYPRGREAGSDISIHAPREGSDGKGGRSKNDLPRISIHAPREGSDTSSWKSVFPLRGFQSTLPVRGATGWEIPDPGRGRFQSTLPVRGATPPWSMPWLTSCIFQSTLPVRGATISPEFTYHFPVISIHAPREGSDFEQIQTGMSYQISIHAPREGSDMTTWWWSRRSSRISIHAPREGSD